MKKIIAILFLISYLFSATELHQLLKMPVVFEHYAEHKQQDKNIGFIEFLAMHYMHGSPKDKDYDRDMQLPFKTVHNCISAISPAYIPDHIQVAISEPETVFNSRNYSSHSQVLLSAYLSYIWQPPKIG